MRFAVCLWLLLLAVFLFDALLCRPGVIHLSFRQEVAVRFPSGQEITNPVGEVNVNTADVDQLQQIKFVGPDLAEKIIQERQQHGRFCFREDLLRVDGIGINMLQKLEGQYCLE